MEYQEFVDYNGPTGAYVATGAKILPFGTAEGIAAATQAAMLASLGPNPEAKQYADAMRKSLAQAHELDRLGLPLHQD